MKLQLKRSNVLEGGFAKEPTTAQMEYGELAVNYNLDDPCIFIKDSGNNIIRISNAGVPILGDINLQPGTLDDRYVRLAGSTMTGSLILNADPTDPLGAATKQYVDTQISENEGAIYTAEAGYGISINADNEIRIGDDWSAIPVLT